MTAPVLMVIAKNVVKLALELRLPRLAIVIGEGASISSAALRRTSPFAALGAPHAGFSVWIGRQLL